MGGDNLGTIRAMAAATTNEAAVVRQYSDDYNALLAAQQAIATAITNAAKTAEESLKSSDTAIGSTESQVRAHTVAAAQAVIGFIGMSINPIASELGAPILSSIQYMKWPSQLQNCSNGPNQMNKFELNLRPQEDVAQGFANAANGSSYGALVAMAGSLFDKASIQTDPVSGEPKVYVVDPGNPDATIPAGGVEGDPIYNLDSQGNEETDWSSTQNLIALGLMVVVFGVLVTGLPGVAGGQGVLGQIADNDTSAYLAQAGIGRSDLSFLDGYMFRSIDRGNPGSGYMDRDTYSNDVLSGVGSSSSFSDAQVNPGAQGLHPTYAHGPTQGQTTSQYDADPLVGWSTGTDSSHTPISQTGTSAQSARYMQDGGL